MSAEAANRDLEARRSRANEDRRAAETRLADITKERDRLAARVKTLECHLATACKAAGAPAKPPAQTREGAEGAEGPTVERAGGGGGGNAAGVRYLLAGAQACHAQAEAAAGQMPRSRRPGVQQSPRRTKRSWTSCGRRPETSALCSPSGRGGWTGTRPGSVPKATCSHSSRARRTRTGNPDHVKADPVPQAEPVKATARPPRAAALGSVVRGWAWTTVAAGAHTAPHLALDARARPITSPARV